MARAVDFMGEVEKMSVDELIARLREIELLNFKQSYSEDVDPSQCQPWFFGICEIEAVAYGLPMPRRVGNAAPLENEKR